MACGVPNEKRLSCAAVLWYSQMQFYYDGRRQLQPLVRQLRHVPKRTVGMARARSQLRRCQTW